MKARIIADFARFVNEIRKAPLGGRGLRVPVGLEAPVLGQGRGHEPVAVEGAGPGGVEGGLVISLFIV